MNFVGAVYDLHMVRGDAFGVVEWICIGQESDDYSCVLVIDIIILVGKYMEPSAIWN